MIDSVTPIGLVAVKLAKHIKNIWLIIKTGPDIAIMHAYGCVAKNHCTSGCSKSEVGQNAWKKNPAFIVGVSFGFRSDCLPTVTFLHTTY